MKTRPAHILDNQYKRRSWSIKTVDRLILMELLQSLLFITALFLTLVFVLILFDELDEIIEHELSFFAGLTYVFLCIPHEIAKASPIIVTLTVVLAIGRMVQRNEMLMLFIGGYHPFRIAAPLVALLFTIMCGLYVMNEFISSRMAAKAEMLLKMSHDTGNLDTMQGFWLYGEEGRVFHINEYRPLTQTISGLTIFEFRGENETISSRMDAEQARYNPEEGAWNLFNVQAHYVQGDGSILRQSYEEHPYM
ncbi:LptF/LptG family permease, partial [bacterium]|nr:LptF/LptG family permease [bacterium]